MSLPPVSHPAHGHVGHAPGPGESTDPVPVIALVVAALVVMIQLGSIRIFVEGFFCFFKKLHCTLICITYTRSPSYKRVLRLSPSERAATFQAFAAGPASLVRKSLML